MNVGIEATHMLSSAMKDLGGTLSHLRHGFPAQHVPSCCVGALWCSQVYDDMRSHGIAPNLHIFSALLMTAAHARSMDLARETLQLMEQVGL
jgi:hypothetical protein